MESVVSFIYLIFYVFIAYVPCIIVFMSMAGTPKM
jgi:hypothetical protein